jgi:hypothetical protein
MKVTRAIRDSLLAIVDDQPISLRAPSRFFTIKRLQFALDYQGYYAGCRYRYYPDLLPSGQFRGWRLQERVFGK